jgi:hypothetical protein
LGELPRPMRTPAFSSKTLAQAPTPRSKLVELLKSIRLKNLRSKLAPPKTQYDRQTDQNFQFRNEYSYPLRY